MRSARANAAFLSSIVVANLGEKAMPPPRVVRSRVSPDVHQVTVGAKVDVAGHMITIGRGVTDAAWLGRCFQTLGFGTDRRSRGRGVAVKDFSDGVVGGQQVNRIVSRCLMGVLGVGSAAGMGMLGLNVAVVARLL